MYSVEVACLIDTMESLGRFIQPHRLAINIIALLKRAMITTSRQTVIRSIISSYFRPGVALLRLDTFPVIGLTIIPNHSDGRKSLKIEKIS